MITAIVHIWCDTCGKLRSVDGAEVVMPTGLEPAWTGWKAVEAARANDWRIDLQNKTVYCDEHGPEDMTDG